MRIAEMRQRERYDAVFSATLEDVWQRWLGESVEVTTNGNGDQEWFVQPLLSAYHVTGLVSSARRFLKDSLRYTPVRHRALPQFVLGTVLGSRVGLRVAAQPGFRVRPAVPRARHLLVMPGNQRIRLFDFDRGISVVHLKRGFDSRTMLREIEIRGAGQSGPFVNITAHGEGWFEEPIVPGYALPRCPPWLSRSKARQQAFELLDTWARPDSEQPADKYGSQLRSTLEENLGRLREKYGRTSIPEIRPLLDRYEAESRCLGTVTIAPSHGDFQPGNIMVQPDGLVRIIDWEHSGLRFSLFDRLVYGLSSRSPRGLAARLQRCAEGQNDSALLVLPRGTEEVRAAISMFLLEEILWRAKESFLGPYDTVSEGLLELCRELAAFD